MTPKHNEWTTIIAKATVEAYHNSCDELKAQLNNPNIVQDHKSDNRRWIELENHFFNVVVAYRQQLPESEYLSLCTKIEILAGMRFSYRPQVPVIQ